MRYVNDTSYRTDRDAHVNDATFMGGYNGFTDPGMATLTAVRGDDDRLKVGDLVFVLAHKHHTTHLDVLTADGSVLYLAGGDLIESTPNPFGAGNGNDCAPVIEMRHDTAMWNEGFSHAQHPLASIPVTDATTATRVVTWAQEELADAGDYTFEFAIVGRPTHARLNGPQAQERLRSIQRSWDGI